MKIAVVGAGITGIACAKLISEAGVSVTVFEKTSHKGGLVRCTTEHQGALFHRVGGHVFNSKDSSVNSWFWKFFDQQSEFYSAKRHAAIFTDSKFTGYPIENNLTSFDADVIKQIISELVLISANPNNLDVAQMIAADYSFKDFLLSKFGQTLCDKYFFPYNMKIWRTDLSSIPLQWLLGKLPMPEPLDIILSNILRSDESSMVHSSFYYPKFGGSQFIIDRISENIEIKYNYDPLPEICTDDGLVIDGDKYDRLVYTGDLRSLSSLSFIQNSGLLSENVLHELPSNATSNLLCKCDPNQFSWVYLPGPESSCHRIIMTGNFSPANNGLIYQSEGKITCTVEFSGEYTWDEMVAQLPYLPFNMSPIAHNFESSSYVIHTKDTRSVVTQLSELLESKNIYLCGRFAQWEYYNMDAAILASMKIVERVLH